MSIGREAGGNSDKVDSAGIMYGPLSRINSDQSIPWRIWTQAAHLFDLTGILVRYASSHTILTFGVYALHIQRRTPSRNPNLTGELRYRYPACG